MRSPSFKHPIFAIASNEGMAAMLRIDQSWLKKEVHITDGLRSTAGEFLMDRASAHDVLSPTMKAKRPRKKLLLEHRAAHMVHATGPYFLET